MPGRKARGLLADPAVDSLAQAVGMAVVPGVLLDHVHEHLFSWCEGVDIIAASAASGGIAY
jgi:hypothetical protein